jgi:DNA polymerase III epsilon subunit-like protein
MPQVTNIMVSNNAEMNVDCSNNDCWDSDDSDFEFEDKAEEAGANSDTGAPGDTEGSDEDEIVSEDDEETLPSVIVPGGVAIVGIDIETNNPQHDRCSIIEIGLYYQPLPPQIPRSIKRRCAPDGGEYGHFNKHSTAVHKIQPSHVANMWSFKQNWEQVIVPFFQSISGKVLLVAHNGYSFDYDILCKVLKRHKLNFPPNVERCCDTLVLLRKHLPACPGSLPKAYKFVTEKEMLGHHDAQHDAEACVKVLLSKQLQEKLIAAKRAQITVSISSLFEKIEKKHQKLISDERRLETRR